MDDGSPTLKDSPFAREQATDAGASTSDDPFARLSYRVDDPMFGASGTSPNPETGPAANEERPCVAELKVHGQSTTGWGDYCSD